MIQPPAFVIALKEHNHSQTMLNTCLKTADDFGWKIHISWGMDGRDITESTWRDLGLTMTGDGKISKRPGVQGCFISHWRLWHKCLELDQQIIILEHDAVFKEAWKPIDPSTHLIKLHTEYWNKRNHITGTWGASTHAYTLSPIHARALIKFSTEHGARPTDVLIGDQVLPWRYLEYMMIDRNTDSRSTTVNVNNGR